MRRYESIPPRLRLHHDQYRTRLDMYCMLFFVFAVLALLGGAVAYRIHKWSGVTLPLSFTILMCISYAASITSARAYGGVLRAIHRGPIRDLF